MEADELIAILAAIIYSGADDNEGPAGYTPKSAVQVARNILRESLEPGQQPANSTTAR